MRLNGSYSVLIAISSQQSALSSQLPSSNDSFFLKKSPYCRKRESFEEIVKVPLIAESEAC